ncbi:MAG: hypothetical protein ACXWKR_12980, partial [Phenylobacterium sp.]
RGLDDRARVRRRSGRPAPRSLASRNFPADLPCTTATATTARSTTLGDRVDLRVYPGATHDFDDPANHRQDSPANASARADATDIVTAFFDGELRPGERGR